MMSTVNIMMFPKSYVVPHTPEEASTDVSVRLSAFAIIAADTERDDIGLVLHGKVSGQRCSLIAFFSARF